MTTDAKPLPLSAEELAQATRIADNGNPNSLTNRLLATIAQQAEQIAAMRAACDWLIGNLGLLEMFEGRSDTDGVIVTLKRLRAISAALNQRGDNE